MSRPTRGPANQPQTKTLVQLGIDPDRPPEVGSFDEQQERA